MAPVLIPCNDIRGIVWTSVNVETRKIENLPTLVVEMVCAIRVQEHAIGIILFTG